MAMKICHQLLRKHAPVYWRTTCAAKSFCTKITSATEQPKEASIDDETLTSRVTNAINNAKIARKEKSSKAPKTLKMAATNDYQPRVNYCGYLKKTVWHNIQPDSKAAEATESDSDSVERTAPLNNADGKPFVYLWKKFILLMGYSGSNYMGMQFNPNVPTIEDSLFTAMLKNNWVDESHVKSPWTAEFQRGSRTDRGVSAARQCCSMKLPRMVDIDALNRELPDDIRVFGVQRVTPTFDARMNCEARTYSYTLPTVSFAHYNDQTSMADYRLPSDQLLKVNQVLAAFLGHTNFHNYTVDKQHFDRSSIRKIYTIACSEPFVLDGVEFARITVKGQSFMLHQIRKMVGFSLAVIREIIPLEVLQRSLTAENFNVPTAPGLGLVLESLHFDKYNRTFGNLHGELDWNKYETEVERFRRDKIDPTIIQTEIRDQMMVNWLEFLVNHSFDEYTGTVDEEIYDDSWGEDPEFWKQIKK